MTPVSSEVVASVVLPPVSNAPSTPTPASSAALLFVLPVVVPCGPKPQLIKESVVAMSATEIDLKFFIRFLYFAFNDTSIPKGTYISPTKLLNNYKLYIIHYKLFLSLQSKNCYLV